MLVFYRQTVSDANGIFSSFVLSVFYRTIVKMEMEPYYSLTTFIAVTSWRPLYFVSLHFNESESVKKWVSPKAFKQERKQSNLRSLEL